jgi:hypothetical protein
MLSPRNIDSHELRNVVFHEGWKHTILKRIVIRNDVANICACPTNNCCDETRLGLRSYRPFRTSLISPGGDCRRKLEAARIRSAESIEMIGHQGLIW